MDLEQIKTHFRKRDRVISVLSEDGFFRVAIINNTQAAITAQQKHKLASAPAELLSKQLAAASLIAVFLKGEERVILETMGDGPISKVYTEAIQVGESRGFVSLESNQITNFSTS
jgi:molecular chaperone Hsp33